MGVLDIVDIPSMLTGAIDYLRDVKARRKDYVLELVILAVAQYLYAGYCSKIPGDSEHVKATPNSVCGALPIKYRRAASHIIRARNAVAHHLGTDKCDRLLDDITADLQLVLELVV